MSADTVKAEKEGQLQVSGPVIDLIRRSTERKDHDRWFDEPSHEHWGDDD